MTNEDLVGLLLQELETIKEQVSKKPKKKRKQTTAKDETPDFVEFWEKIWRPHARATDGRGDARDAFVSHVENGANPKDIVDGARYLIRSFKDFQYLPLAKTWINKRAYEDLAVQERAHQSRIVEAQQRRAHDTTNVVQMPPQPTLSPEKKAEMAERLKGLAVSLRQA